VARFPLWTAVLAALLGSSCLRHETASNAAVDQSGTATGSLALPDTQLVESPLAAPKRAAAAPMSRALPDRAGTFVAGPLVIEPQFVRRIYSLGTARISVTIAAPDATPMKYDEWVKLSASSPQVTLEITPNAGNGFYDCVGRDTAGICNVHIHLRSGHHLEMMGEGHAYRADFDALLPELRLRDLTAESPLRDLT
jgi:hypothetical protein